MIAKLASLVVTALGLVACTSTAQPGGGTPVPSTPASSPASSSALGSSVVGGSLPNYAHIVVVIEENHANSQIIGSPDAPYLNSLAAAAGVRLAASYGITHPSEPNYLALFSGSTQGVTDDSCPRTFDGDNLGHQLLSHRLSFVAYAEDLPSPGYAGCSSGAYARKHAPWTDFADLPVTVGQPMSAFPSDFATLPRVAFVVPNLNDDMHDGTIAQADIWLRAHLGGYAAWASSHDSLLIVTWDEDDYGSNNQVPGILVGAHLRPEVYALRVDHYTMLRTLEALCGLPALGQAAARSPLAGIWVRG